MLKNLVNVIIVLLSCVSVYVSSFLVNIPLNGQPSILLHGDITVDATALLLVLIYLDQVIA